MKQILLFVGLLAASLTSRAAVLVSEDFAAGAPGSSILGLGGGLGFAGTWHPGGFNASVSNVQNIASGSLNFGGLPTSGNRLAVGTATAIAGVERTFSQSLGTTGTTRYISLLLRPEGTLNAGLFSGFFGLALEGPAGGIFFGKGGGGILNDWIMEDRGGTNQQGTGIAAQVGVTTLFVLKSEFFAGNDRFTLFVNPTPGQPEPATGLVKSNLDLGTIAAATIYSGGAFSADGLKVGDTFASVTAVPPIPEPGTGLFGLMLLGACGRARRHRSS